MPVITVFDQIFEPDKEHPPHKLLPDGRGLWIIEITFGRARIAVGRTDVQFYDDIW